MADSTSQGAVDPDAIGVPSPLFTAQIERLVEANRHGRVLDLACGRGRHALAAARLGLNVLAVDRNAESLATLEAALAKDFPSRFETRAVDLETEAAPDLPPEPFGAILVFRYLHRPLMPWIESRLATGGVLLYETFTTDQRTLGWGPKRDDFLLEPGELPTLFPNLEVLHFEEGLSEDPRPAHTARLLATRSR